MPTAMTKDGMKWYSEDMLPKPSGTNYKDYLGSNFNYLTDTVKKGIEGNDSVFDKLLGNATRRIGGVTDRNVRSIRENLASSGFRGTGANLINDAYRSEADAVSQTADSLANQEIQYKQNAINQLLGLNQQEGGMAFNANQSNIQQNQWLKTFLENQRQFNESLQFQKDNQPSVWEEILGGLFGAGAKIGTAYLTGGA